MKGKFSIFVLFVSVLSGPWAWAVEMSGPAPQDRLRSIVLSETDREAIGRVTFAEADNQGDTGLAAVVFVILNRLVSGRFGSSVDEILDAKNQFEPATRAGGWEKLPPLTAKNKARIDTIINLALDGRLPDPTNGSLYFQNPATVTAREKAGLVTKGLTRFGGSVPAAVIRDHEFYSAVKGREMIPVPLKAEKQPEPEPWDIFGQARRKNLQTNASWDVFTRRENQMGQ